MASASLTPANSSGNSAMLNHREGEQEPVVVITNQEKHHFRRAKLVWHIPDFGKLLVVNAGDKDGPEYLESSDFHLMVALGAPDKQVERTLKMRLALGSNRKEEDAKFFGAFLLCYPVMDVDKKCLPVRISMEISVILDGKILARCSTANKSYVAHSKANAMWGSVNFIPKAELEKHLKAGVKDEMLTINCNVTIFCQGPALVGSELGKANNQLGMAEQLWSSRDSADVTIVCTMTLDDGTTEHDKDGGNNGDDSPTSFSCHKSVLTARSKVFEAMFQHEETPEHQMNTVKIEDIDAKTMEQFIEFLYKDTCPILHLNGRIEGVGKLLKAADKYDIETMKNSCEQYLSTQVDAHNVGLLCKMADSYNADLLLATVVNFAASNFDAILSHCWWVDLNKKVIDKILSATLAHRLWHTEK